ncbi:hypothetical protein AB0M44_03640 [Streptosporangium subroseum]|uniref:hypothetical protein n=1 Tax=Streptosporangium subroseum TaxID=106412 RepID=UPI00344A1DBB
MQRVAAGNGNLMVAGCKLQVGLLCETMGFDTPILPVPLLKGALARHLAFGRSLDALREMGVRVLFDPAAPSHARMPSWEQVMRELRSAAGRQNSQG